MSKFPGVVGAHDPQQEAGDSAWILSPEMGSGNGVFAKAPLNGYDVHGETDDQPLDLSYSGYTIFGQSPTVRFEHGNSYEPQLVR